MGWEKNGRKPLKGGRMPKAQKVPRKKGVHASVRGQKKPYSARKERNQVKRRSAPPGGIIK